MTHYRGALAVAAAVIGNPGRAMLLVDPLEALAAMAAAAGRHAAALRLAGAAAAIQARLGRPPWPAEPAGLEHALATARGAGQAMTPEQAVAEAGSWLRLRRRSPFGSARARTEVRVG